MAGHRHGPVARRPVPDLAPQRSMAAGEGERCFRHDLRRHLQGRQAESEAARSGDPGPEAEDAEEPAPGGVRCTVEIFLREHRRGSRLRRPRAAGQIPAGAGRHRGALRRAVWHRARHMGPRIRFRPCVDPARRHRGARDQGLHVDAQGDVPQGNPRSARHGRARCPPRRDEVVMGRRARTAAVPADILSRPCGRFRRRRHRGHLEFGNRYAGLHCQLSRPFRMGEGSRLGLRGHRSRHHLLRARRPRSRPPHRGLGGDGHPTRGRQVLPRP